MAGLGPALLHIFHIFRRQRTGPLAKSSPDRSPPRGASRQELPSKARMPRALKPELYANLLK